MERKCYSREDLEKILKKHKKHYLKEVRASISKKERTFENVMRHFYYEVDNYSNYDSYFACRMLLVEFFGKRKFIDYLEFILDVAMEYIEPEDINALKNFASIYKEYYGLLLRRLENVSTNK